MCTAATYLTKDFYFGRTLDYDFSYGEEIAVLPRRCALAFRHMDGMERHYAMIGMAHVEGDFPLYYDAVNEKGLGMAGLNFVGNARYKETAPWSSKGAAARWGKESARSPSIPPAATGTVASIITPPTTIIRFRQWI